MNVRRWIPLGSSVLLVALTLASLFWTRDLGPSPDGGPNGKSGRGKNAAPARVRVVDERPLQTARSLAPLATTPEEAQWFLQAERTGNHAVDLAFTDALLQALESPKALTAEALQLLAARKKAEDAVEADRRLVTQLTRQIPAAKGPQQDALEDQLDVAKAQLELDQDELDDVAADLESAGGDPQAKIHRLKAAHEAADRTERSVLPAVAPWRSPTGSLWLKAQSWLEQNRKLDRLTRAQTEANERAQRMLARRPVLQERVEKGRLDRERVKEKAKGFSRKGQALEAGTSKETAQETINALRRHMTDQRLLADLGKRLQDQHELVEIYDNWLTLARTHRRSALHSCIQSLLIILVLVMAIILGERLTERLTTQSQMDREGQGTLSTLLKIGCRAAGSLGIVFVVVGLPTQTSTILGLAGAGLTVALKDFIVAFFGWFVLMGKNGLRVGDWVEIKGVGGEVVEVGLLRTILLETGNWSDAAHPTGRRVAFANSFAIEGHFFNFSTSGQWMWDELRAPLPANRDPKPILAEIQKLVEAQTRANAEVAETEWQRTTSRYRVHAFSTVPDVHLVSTGNGMEVCVRYITRAHESNETRRHLNQAMADLLQDQKAE